MATTDKLVKVSSLKIAYDDLGNKVNNLKSALTSRINFLALEQGSYNTGSGNPLASDKVVRTITKISEQMFIDTLTDSIRIAHAYVYNVSDNSYVSYSEIGARSATITPSSGTYVKLTFNKPNNDDITPNELQPGMFATTMWENVNDTQSNTLALTVTEDISSQYVKGKYINNSGSVGTTVSTTPVSNASYAYIIVPCRKGDVFKLTGTGGGSQRLYSFTDESYKIIRGAAQNTTATGEEFVAPNNGYFISNVAVASSYALIVTHRANVGELSFMGQTNTDYTQNFIVGSTIIDNGSVGSVINITPTQNDAYAHIIVKCIKGDRFTLSGKGGSTALIWCFTDKNYKKLSGASVITVSNLQLNAEKDGYLICNVQWAVAYSLVKTGYFDPSVPQNIANNLRVGFIMPSNLYGKTGDTLYAYTPEMFSNYKHLNNYQLTLSGLTNAQSIEDSVAPRMVLPFATKTLTFIMQNYSNNETVKGKTSVKTVAPTSGASAKVLVIADSFIRYKWGDGVLAYVDGFAEDDGVTFDFIGTKTTGYGYQAEARGGWSAVDYLTHYVPVAERDPSASDEQKKMPSPFVFSDNDTVADAYFDFAKYITDNDLDVPDIIMISLGMNAGDTSAPAIAQMITNIHSDYPNIKIIVSMIPTVPRRIDTGDFYARKTSRENQNLSYLATFDGRESEKVYLSAEHLAIEGILGLTGSEQNVNPVSLLEGDEVMEIVNTGIHPTAIGAWNLAKWKYNALVYVMSLA